MTTRDALLPSVYLSYASEDSEAAVRISDALSGAGIAVCDDHRPRDDGETRGLRIERQIGECSLFVAIISANTQARPNGNLLVEWRLAEQRSLLITNGRQFILPVNLD